jgi:hypothetical protein
MFNNHLYPSEFLGLITAKQAEMIASQLKKRQAKIGVFTIHTTLLWAW